MVYEAGLLSLIIALIRRGSLSRLANLDIKRIWLIFIPFSVSIIGFICNKYFPDIIKYLLYGGFLRIAMLSLFLAFFLVNRHLPGMYFMFAGWFLNLLPNIANAGRMPVSVWAAKFVGVQVPTVPTSRHMPMSPDTHLNFLGDWIPVPLKCLKLANVISPGDILLAIGLFWLIQVTMCLRKKREATELN